MTLWVSANQTRSEYASFQFSFAQFLERWFRCTVMDSNISAIMEDINFAYLCSRDAIFPGQRTKDISRSNFLFLAAVDQ
jgi:hypothetical protein